MKYGLGCMPYEEDDRDYKFNDLINCNAVYPEKYISPLPYYRLNQGYTNMCTAFAASMARYMYELNDSKNTELLSYSYIYANRSQGDYKGEGLVIRQALNNLVKNGVCYLNSFNDMGDYQSVYRKYTTRRFILDDEAHPYRISSYYSLNNDNEIKQAVVTSGCAVVSYNVYDNWYNTKSDGKIGYNSGKFYGAHCVLIVGWDNNEWIILNSWGNIWGDNGLGYIPMSVIKNEAWCMIDNIQEIFFNSLKDIQGHWAYSSIMKAVRKGVVKGYEDLTFKPDNALTRAEACVIIAKINGYNGEDIKNVYFADIDKDVWYKNYVGYCKQNGFISGYKDGTFKPMNNLTRAETAKILCLVSGTECDKKDSSVFTDVNMDHWAAKYINSMRKKGIITGYEDGSFKPDNYITRAEFIVMADRLGLI